MIGSDGEGGTVVSETGSSITENIGHLSKVGDSDDLEATVLVGVGIKFLMTSTAFLQHLFHPYNWSIQRNGSILQ